MAWLDFVAWFFGDAFLATAVPHSPFATTPGKGVSSYTVNALWELMNLAVGSAVAAISLPATRQYCRLHGGLAPRRR